MKKDSKEYNRVKAGILDIISQIKEEILREDAEKESRKNEEESD